MMQTGQPQHGLLCQQYKALSLNDEMHVYDVGC